MNWADQSEGHRINRLKIDLRDDKYAFTDLLEAENAALYPLLVGGTKEQFERIEAMTGRDVSDLISIAPEFLHPSQVDGRR